MRCVVYIMLTWCTCRSHDNFYILFLVPDSPCGAWGHCRISPPRFLAESRKRRLNRGSFGSAVCLVVYFLWFVLCLCVYLWFILSFFLIVCLSVTVKWLAVKTASTMTYTVSGGALNSAQSNPISPQNFKLVYDWLSLQQLHFFSLSVVGNSQFWMLRSQRHICC